MNTRPQVVLEPAAQDRADATAKPPFLDAARAAIAQETAFLRDALGT